MQQRGLLLKCLIFCCFLLVVQNLLQSLDQVPTSLTSMMGTTPSSERSPSMAEEVRQPLQKREFLLSVPFYVYEDLAWTGATIGGKKVDNVANPKNNNSGTTGKFKHGGDYWMMQASLNMEHPMRTRNMSEAKLFFVPWLLNFFDYKIWKSRKLCVKGSCDIPLLLKSLDKLLESPAFQKYPDHHVIVRSFYSSAYDKWNAILLNKNPNFQRFLDAFQKMQVLVFENKDLFPKPGRYSFTSYHVGSPCPIYQDDEGTNSNTKPYDVAMIANLQKSKPAFKYRRKICNWLSQINEDAAAAGATTTNHQNNKTTTTTTTTAIRTSVCGEGLQCPALAASKFGFHVAGDTYSSQRLMDTILSGTVPIFTNLHQYELAGSDWIDWSQLSYYLPVHNDTAKIKKAGGTLVHKVSKHSMLPAADRKAFERRLRAILNDKEGYERKHKAVLEHIPLFDYTTLYPFDTYMYLFQAQLFPETRHPIGSSRWSALRLPPPLFDHPTT